jgi:hypothetical protein
MRLMLVLSFSLLGVSIVSAQQRQFLNVSPSPQAPSMSQQPEMPLSGFGDDEDHPANAEQRKHSSFHRPNRSMNYHSNGIRKHGTDLSQTAACVLAEQMANGLSTICFYNCHGHQYSLTVDSMTDCSQTVSETSFRK